MKPIFDRLEHSVKLDGYFSNTDALHLDPNLALETDNKGVINLLLMFNEEESSPLKTTLKRWAMLYLSRIDYNYRCSVFNTDDVYEQIAMQMLCFEYSYDLFTNTYGHKLYYAGVYDHDEHFPIVFYNNLNSLKYLQASAKNDGCLPFYNSFMLPTNRQGWDNSYFFGANSDYNAYRTEKQGALYGGDTLIGKLNLK